jgi:hypothetical protein
MPSSHYWSSGSTAPTYYNPTYVRFQYFSSNTTNDTWNSSTINTLFYNTDMSFYQPPRLRRTPMQAPAIVHPDLERQEREERERQRITLTNQQEAAKARARQLLLEHLSPEQRQTFEEKKWFIVVGGKTGKRYRIREGQNLIANIDVMADNDNKISHRLCAHAKPGLMPMDDHLLAQKIFLELDEDCFLRTANRHPAWG